MDDRSIASSKYSSRPLKMWFWILLLLNCVFIIGSKNYLRPLDTNDIIKFETAKYVPVAENLLQEWAAAPHNGKVDKAVEAIYLDYLFIALYVAGLSIACIYLSKLTGHEILRKAGRFIPFLLLAAGICDIVENVAMWYSMNGHLTQWNVTVTYDMAVTKFSIVILSLLFILVCLIFYMLRIMTRGSETATSFHTLISQK